MSELNYPHDNNQWAWERGIKRKCMKHGTEYDPNIGCLGCKLEEAERKKKTEMKKQRLREAFENIIWPDDNS